MKRACVDILRGVTARLWFAAQGECPFAECSSQNLALGRRCEGASALSGRAGSGGMAGGRAKKAFARPILLPHEGEPVGSGFRGPETPSKAAGPREPGGAPPRFAFWRPEGRGRKRLALLSGSEARWGCGLLPEESFPLQNAAVRSSFGVSVRRDLGAEQPSWLMGHSWGLGAEGLRAPNPASPRRRTRGEWVSLSLIHI